MGASTREVWGEWGCPQVGVERGTGNVCVTLLVCAALPTPPLLYYSREALGIIHVHLHVRLAVRAVDHGGGRAWLGDEKKAREGGQMRPAPATALSLSTRGGEACARVLRVLQHATCVPWAQRGAGEVGGWWMAAGRVAERKVEGAGVVWGTTAGKRANGEQGAKSGAPARPSLIFFPGPACGAPRTHTHTHTHTHPARVRSGCASVPALIPLCGRADPAL